MQQRRRSGFTSRTDFIKASAYAAQRVPTELTAGSATRGRNALVVRHPAAEAKGLVLGATAAGTSGCDTDSVMMGPEIPTIDVEYSSDESTDGLPTLIPSRSSGASWDYECRCGVRLPIKDGLPEAERNERRRVAWRANDLRRERKRRFAFVRREKSRMRIRDSCILIEGADGLLQFPCVCQSMVNIEKIGLA